MGIWMTEESWFGVTPEPIAKYEMDSITSNSLLTLYARTIAKHLSIATTPDKAVLIDCFAGVGGNTIAFACSGRWKRVYAIEKDKTALACAKHNAGIYGVQDQISWYEGDCFEVLHNELADLSTQCVIFASPPWGGQSSFPFNLSLA